jgi:hypothetical protein
MLTLQFIAEAPRALVSEIGKLELKWYTASATTPTAATLVSTPKPTEQTDEKTDVFMTEEEPPAKVAAVLSSERDEQRDLDVAEDDERWMG